MRLTGLQFLRSSFLPSLKIWTTFSSFQAAETSLGSQDCSRILTEVLWWYQPAFWGSSDECHQGPEICRDPAGAGQTGSWSFLQSWPFSSRHWNPLGPSSVLKTKEKNELNTSASSVSLFWHNHLLPISLKWLYFHLMGVLWVGGFVVVFLVCVFFCCCGFLVFWFLWLVSWLVGFLKWI